MREARPQLLSTFETIAQRQQKLTAVLTRDCWYVARKCVYWVSNLGY